MILRLLLPLTLLLFNTTIRAQITADFIESPADGCAPLVVSFHNTTTGSPTSYKWDLGNGTVITNPASTPDAAGTFLTAGTYTVILKAYNGTTLADTKTRTVTVYPKPNVAFSTANTTICAGGSVSFNNTSDGGTGVTGTLQYNWNFGDGSSNTNPNPAHTYNISGYFNVTLQVINSHGCDSIVSKVAYVNVLPLPAINFTITGTGFCQTPAHAIFTDITTGAGGNSYLWNFGDGNTSTLQDPAHDYTKQGAYDVTLTVTDKNGCKSTLTKFSGVVIDSLNADFSVSSNTCAGSAITFVNTTANAFTLNSKWDFGDGATSPFINTVHTYNAPGTYKVRLIVSGGACTDTVIKPVTVNPVPAATIAASPQLPCPAPATVTFHGTGSTPGTMFTWYFPDDNSVVTNNDPVHIFKANAYDTIAVVVKDGNGCVDTMQYVEKVNELHLAIGKAKHGLCEGDLEIFDLIPQTLTPNVPPPGIAYPAAIASAVVDYGDGSPSGTSLSHIYTVYGHDVATITATLDNGCTVTDTFSIDVGTPPAVTLKVTPIHICVRGFITFSVTATGAGPLTYAYDFGDGTSIGAMLNDSSVAHQYLQPGIYQGVSKTPPWLDSIIVYNSGCPTVIPGPVLIVDSPKAKMSYSTSCDTPLMVSFIDSSQGETSGTWYFGDGTTDAVSSHPIHFYTSFGVKTVLLVAHNSGSGCNDTATVTIDLVQLKPSFVADDTVICVGGIVNFTAMVAGGIPRPQGYYWYIDNVIPYRTDPGITETDTFYTQGKHTILLKVQDEYSCFTSFVRPLYISVAKPNVGFATKVQKGCAPFTVSIMDNTTDTGNLPIVRRTWQFGDSSAMSAGNQSTITHTFVRPGYYNVTLYATDNLGCEDSATAVGLIDVDKPQAVLSVTNTNVCKGRPVNLFNNTSNVVLAYSYWSFGDGDSITVPAANPVVHNYKQNGIYNITLVVEDSLGCKDTVYKPAYVKVTSPTALFTETDSIGICPGLKDSFINASSPGNYFWSFGDGNTSSLTNPANIYNSFGVFPVYLVVTDINGCTDTATGVVKIYGYSGTFTYDATMPGCVPFTVNFTANVTNVPNITFDYTDGTVDIGSNTTATHTYTKPNKYLPKVILGKGGCTNSITAKDTIIVDQILSIVATSPLCVYDTIQFKDSSFSYFSPVIKWLWKFSDGKLSNNQNTFDYYTAPGIDSVLHVVINSNGCTDTLIHIFYVNPLPVITTVKDTVICAGDAATLTGYGGISYSWSPSASVGCSNCATTTASPAVKTLYTVTGTDANGCSDKDTVSVSLKTQTTSFPCPGGAICAGDSIVLTDSGAQQYSWSPPTGLSSTVIPNPTARPASSITYTVIANEGSCLPNTDYITVTVYPRPVVRASGSTTIIAGSDAQLQVTGTNAVRFGWSPSGSLSCDSCSDPVARPDSTTVYTAYGISNLGCEDSDKVRINVLCDQSQVFIPNTFTPNGDGQNDMFYPRGVGLSAIVSFRIYNRWGELIFERTNFGLNDEKSGWNGTFNGSQPRPDVYIYVLDAVCASGAPISWKGDVTVIR